MTNKPSSKEKTPKSEKQAEEVLQLAQKALREGKGGTVTDGKGNFAIVEV